LDLNFHLCVLIRRQKFRDGDPAQRLAFCNQFVNTVEKNPGFLDQLIVSDEAIFSLNSEINTRNVRKYAAHDGDVCPADHYVGLFEGADQVMVWIGLTRTEIVLGPHFVQGNLDTREYLRIKRYNVVQRDFPINVIDRNAMF
jgi:hypothetical protein